MGLAEDEFWFCTPHFFVHKLNGMRGLMKAKNEAETRRSWEQTRFIAWAAGHWKEGTRIDEVIQFEWEKPAPGELMKRAIELKEKWIWNEPNWGKINKQYFD